MKKPYIKKYCVFAGFYVWIVNGKYVRENLDEEFTNFGQHYRFKFIPKNEFWIDEEHGGDDEEKYFLENMLVQYRLMSKGASYSKAVEKAELAEKRERKKKEHFLNKTKIVHTPEMFKEIHKNLLQKYSKKIKVWIVNGRIVRDLFYVDFTEGGHDKVYNFVPRNEIWLDDDLSRSELKFVLLHEIHERNLMSKGKDYGSAHKSASEIEFFCRKHSKKVDLELKKEFEIANNS